MRRKTRFPIGTNHPYLATARGFRAVAMLAFALALVATGANAQWRRTTPRDTIFVPARQKAGVLSNIPGPECTKTEFFISGTFGIFPGQDSTGFDGRYMYSDPPGWNAPTPLANPPSWNGTNYQVYLQVSNNYAFTDADSIHVLETSYQPSHEYTAIYTGIGGNYEFRIFDRINSDSTGSDYALATGGLKVRLAQYTAGISVQKSSLNFPLTPVGMSSSLVDSIASYGIDALVVDSMWIGGPRSYEFSFSGAPQRAAPFTLPNESANKFTISYFPSRPDSESVDTLYLRCSNAECDQRLIAIVLTGKGGAPRGSIGPDTLDFGTVRAHFSSLAYANGFNAGTAPWVIDSISIVPASAAQFFSWNLTSLPYQVQPGNEINIKFTFTPALTIPYQATAIISTHDGKQTRIVLIGTGATSLFTVLDTSHDFGTVLTGNTKVFHDTVRNDGNWPAYITDVELTGAQKLCYSFSDAADSSGFILDAGASRYYTITYHPNYNNNLEEFAYLQFNFDDHSKPKIISLTGYEKTPQISYSSKRIDFGIVEVNMQAHDTDTVRNASGSIVSLYETVVPSGVAFWQSPALSPPNFNPGSTPLPFLFWPHKHGAFSAETYLTWSNGQYDSIYLYGYGAEAHPVFTPSNLNFGIVSDFDTTTIVTLLRDTGDYQLAICNAEIVGPDASEFTLQPLHDRSGTPHSLPDTLRDASLDTLVFPVSFTTHALAGRVHHATLVVEYCNGTVDSIPLRATEEDQFIQFCSYKVDFGKVRVGTKVDTTTCFFNGANVALPVNSIWITQPGLPFSLAHTAGTVPSNATFLDSTTFAPLARGTFTGMLHGAGGGMKNDSIVITGIGAQSAPALSAKQEDFGTVTLLDTSIPQLLTLSDTGDWPLIARIEKINDPNNEFSVQIVGTNVFVNPLAFDTLAIGEKSYYSITFTPRHPELPDHESKLVFNYDDGTVDTVLLIGRDTSNFLAFNRDTIDFGKIRLSPAPVTQTLALVNTSSRTLTARTLTSPALPFATNAAPPIAVTSGDSVQIQVSFKPVNIGFYQSTLSGTGAPFNDSLWNTVVLEGTGAAPLPKLSVDTLDFDTVALGHTVTKSFTLSNLGNWPLLITRAPISGPNAGDFTPLAIALDTAINDSEQTSYSVTFLASTLLQLTPRLGYITWTMDNGDTFRLVLRAYDEPPYLVHIGFPHAYWGRPGDKIAAELDLQSDIPDTLAIQHISGMVTYDPSVVDGPEQTGGVQPGALLPTPNWKTVIRFIQPNAFSFDISSTTDTLSKAGTLLNFAFKLHSNLTDGASSPLIGYDTLPGTYEAIATQAQTSIFLDSNCGTIHLLAGGAPIASFIQQNSPNPFGASSGSTALPFDVGADNTIVTIRLLDPTGREVLRPVDHQSFARGRYSVTISANALSSGIYFYEFRAGDAPPQMKKMAVE